MRLMDSLVMLGELSSCSTWASLGVARGLSRPVACRILVLQPEIKPESAVLQGGFLTTGPPRKSPKRSFLTMLHKTASQPLLLLLSHFRRVRLCVTPQTAAHQAPLSMGFSRQEYWSGLLFPPSGNCPHPGIKPHLFCLLLRQTGFFFLPLVPPAEPSRKQSWPVKLLLR